MRDTLDPSKLRVAELRAELQARGLDTKGRKTLLAERLREALREADGHRRDAGDIKLEPDHDEQEEEEEEDPGAVHELEPDHEFKREAEHDNKPGVELEPEGDLEAEPEHHSELEPTSLPREDELSQEGLSSFLVLHADVKSLEEEDFDFSYRQHARDNTAFKEEAEDKFDKMGFEDATVHDMSEVKEELSNGYEGSFKSEEIDIKEESIEPKQEPSNKEERRGEKRRGHFRSRSPDSKSKKQRLKVEEEVIVEDEPKYDKSAVLLDWHNSDLSLLINKEDFLSAQPLTMQGFCYVWHGVRATYGFTNGRIFYEVKVLDCLPVPQLEEDEKHPHVVRVGWSIDEAGLTLGEDPFSYGYDGTGKASTNLKFKDYGKMFGKGDIVGCYLDLEAEPILMSFTVNGENQGMAYEILRSTLGERALFPHIVTKNCSFKVNFGTEEPWFTPLRYTYVGHKSLQDRVLGGQGPATREEAEVIMMVGLPACGKTVWVEKYCKENPEKKYYVLGTKFLIDKMKVNGLPRKRNYSGRWDVLIEHCTMCLDKLLEMSYKRRRNFIIDQTNVYPSAQRRKMKGFAGFYRWAVVICPTDENLKKQTEKREKEEGKEVPDKAVLEMKANFKLPEEGELFDAVEFVELQREEASELVAQYNKEGESADFGQKRGFRGGFHDRRGGFKEKRGVYGNRGSSTLRGGWDPDHHGGYTDCRDRGEVQRDYSKDHTSHSGGYDNDWSQSSEVKMEYSAAPSDQPSTSHGDDAHAWVSGGPSVRSKTTAKTKSLMPLEIDETLPLSEDFDDSESYKSESDYDSDILDGLSWSDDDDDVGDPSYIKELSSDSDNDDSDQHEGKIIGEGDRILQGRGSLRRRQRWRGRSSSSRSSSSEREGVRMRRSTLDDGWTDGHDFVPNNYAFTGSAGVTRSLELNPNSQESDYFCLFIDDEVLQVMVNETNRYHSHCRAGRPPTVGKKKEWFDVGVGEIIVFLALTLLMPHISKHYVKDYWSTDTFIQTPIFSNYMSRDRYGDIYQFLHFTDNTLRNPQSSDRLWKIRNIMEMIRERFKKYFYPFKNLAIDESSVLFKGSLVFKQYIRKKRHHFGIKVYVICDCKTGYVMDIVLYAGAGVDIRANDPLGHSGAVVKMLIEPYLDQGHVLYTHNFYTSPGLSSYLHENNTGLVGIVRDNRRGMPVFPRHMKKGDTVYRKKDHHLAIKWKDRKEFVLLSGIHTGQMVSTGKQNRRTGETIYKPDVIVDYLKNMRLVDKSDMEIGHIECTRKRMKWYKKALLHIIHVCMLNAYSLFKLVTNKSISLREFSLNVCKQLLTRHGEFKSNVRGRRVEPLETSRLAPRQWCETHHIAHLPPIRSRRIGQRICFVCANTTKRKEGRKRKRVSTWCPGCGVGLCLPCFKEYHSHSVF